MSPASEKTESNRWLIVLCGLPGDSGHRERLTDAVQRIAGASQSVFQVTPERIRVLVGDETMASQLGSVVSNPGICDRESVPPLFQSLDKEIQPQDSCWIILLGHAQLYAGRSTFNVKGLDFDATALSQWLAPIQCRERVIMLTMPVSGFWLKPLRAPNTVLISATEADLEITATEMPYALADVVSGGEQVQALEDIDDDGQLSLHDLYLAVSLEVHGRFKSMARLQTEHSRLDDNGDGIGKEIQIAFLPPDEADAATKKQPKKKTQPTKNNDGDYSKSILIGKPLLLTEKDSTKS